MLLQIISARKYFPNCNLYLQTSLLLQDAKFFESFFFHKSPLQQQQQRVLIQAFDFLKTVRLVSVAESKTMQDPIVFGSVGVGVAGIHGAIFFESFFFHESPLQQQQQCVMKQAFIFLKTVRLVSVAESKTMQDPIVFGSVGVGVAGIHGAIFFESFFFHKISSAAAEAVCVDSGVCFLN